MNSSLVAYCHYEVSLGGVYSHCGKQFRPLVTGIEGKSRSNGSVFNRSSQASLVRISWLLLTPATTR